jgi:murein DD-endopeptidase MepM/ murein hydrolase activator NlpD
MFAVADRGLQAYAVPSARAGQQTDPSARRDALSGLLTVGFLMVIVVAVLAIVIAAPKYAKPAAGAGLVPVESSAPSPDASALPTTAPIDVPLSKSPDDLKGYRWPVRGGMIAKYYDQDREGRFAIESERVHTGLVITWFEGAAVKAAHKGEVVAAGRDWESYLEYDDSLDKVYKRLARKDRKPSEGVVIDDGNGYRSIYSELKDLRVEVGDVVKAGQTIGGMSRAEGRQMMRYRLVRRDGPWMRVHASDRERDYPDYAREQIDPMIVFNIDATKRPDTTKRQPPADPPRLSDY